MNKILTIIKREYRESVFKKSFIVITILTPLIMIVLSVAPALLMNLSPQKVKHIDVIDNSSFVFDELQATLSDTLPDGRALFNLRRLPASQPFDSLLNHEKALVSADKIDGLLIIPSTILSKNGKVEFYTKTVANYSLNGQLKTAIKKVVTNHRILLSGIDPQLVKEITRPIAFKTVKVIKGGQSEERGFMEEYFSTFILVFILYMTLIMYGSAIMRTIVQEKTSRIIEILLSGSNPFQLMSGKILGQGAVGLTQYILWALFGMALIFLGGKGMPISGKYFHFSALTLFYFVLFFILGYLIYSVLYAAIGAMTNSDQEAQQLSFPVVFLLIIPIVMNGYLVKNPDSTVSVVMSLIPFFSPIIMFARINLSSPPFIEIAASITILILTIVLLIWLVAKIFRVGILMYGKRPTLPEIVKWLRYK